MLENHVNRSTITNWRQFYSEWLDSVKHKNLNEEVFRKGFLIFDCEIELTGEYIHEFNFNTCTFKKNVIIKNGLFNKPVMFDNNEFLTSISFTGKHTNFLENLTLWGCNGKVIFNDGSYNNVTYNNYQLTGCEKNEIFLTGGTFNNLKINSSHGSFIEYLKILINQVKGNIEIYGERIAIKENIDLLEGTIIKKMEIEGQAFDVNLSIFNISLGFLNIYNFKSESGIRFILIQPINDNSEIKFNQAFLGKSEFTSINFDEFEDIEIIDSYLLDCTFCNINWNYNFNSKMYQQVKNRTLRTPSGLYGYRKIKHYYFAKKRDVCRQIKFTYIKSGDTVNEQKLHGLEMLFLDKSLKWNLKNISTKLIIKLSILTSNFGQSISRPILSLLCGHTILYFTIFYLKLNGQNIIARYSFDSKEIANDFYNYFYLINPLHIVNVDGYFILIDLAMRIWSSYMIYNIIRASRRFIK